MVIKRDTGQQYSVKIDVFCEEDRLIIRNWNQASVFLDESCLSISLERKIKGQEELNEADEYYYYVSYDINLKNQTSKSISNIRIESSILSSVTFLDRKHPEHPLGEYHAAGLKPETFKFKELPTDKTTTVSTGSWEANRVLTDKEIQIIEINGIWLRIFMTLPDGQELMREIKEPISVCEGFEWTNDGPRHPEKSNPKYL